MGRIAMRFLKIFCVLIALLFFASPFGKKRDPDARKPAVYVAWIGGCFWLIAARLAQAEEHQKKLFSTLEFLIGLDVCKALSQEQQKKLLAALESGPSGEGEPPRESGEDEPPREPAEDRAAFEEREKALASEKQEKSWPTDAPAPRRPPG